MGVIIICVTVLSITFCKRLFADQDNNDNKKSNIKTTTTITNAIKEQTIETRKREIGITDPIVQTTTKENNQVDNKKVSRITLAETTKHTSISAEVIPKKTETTTEAVIETEYIPEETTVITTTEEYIEPVTETTTTIYNNSVGDYSAYDLQTMGIIYWGGYRYTYYSELVLAGEGLQIEGRHVDENGFVCDGNGYICVASGSLSWGTIVDTPFGKQGRVYDSGCTYDVIDVYVHW